MLEDLVDAIEPIARPRGRRRKRQDKFHADKAYDFAVKRRALRQRGIRRRIARRGIERSERLGRYRRVVERTFAWLNRFRRLTVRYERQGALHQAFLDLDFADICRNFLQRTVPEF